MSELTDFEFGEELKKYQFRDWRFEPVFISDGRPGLPGGEDAACRSLGVRIWYVAEDNRFPGLDRQITLHISRFFDSGKAERYKQGWPVWVRGWLWGHVRWVLDHEAREQFFYDGQLPFDPHAATGGTVQLPKPDEARPLPGAAQYALQPTPHGARLRRLRKAHRGQSSYGRG